MRSKSCCRAWTQIGEHRTRVAVLLFENRATTGSFISSKYRYGIVTDVPYRVMPMGRSGGKGGGVGKAGPDASAASKTVAIMILPVRRLPAILARASSIRRR